MLLGMMFNFANYFSQWSRCCSVSQSCSTLCDPMDCSTPGFPVLYRLLELAQAHVHWIGDATQQSHPLLSPSLPVCNLSQHQGLFALDGQSIGASPSAIVLPMNIQDWFPLGLTGWISLQTKGLLKVFSNITQFKSINSSVLSFLYSPTLTSIHDYWKKGSLV